MKTALSKHQQFITNLIHLSLSFGIIGMISCQSIENKSYDRNKLISLRKSKIEFALKQRMPVIKLYEDSSLVEYKAQEIALSDPKLSRLYIEENSKKPMLNEVFSVSNSRPSDLVLNQKNCTSKNCYRVEVYNYAVNGMVISIVDLISKSIISSEFYPSMQPDVPPHLAELAIAIAIEDTSVIHAYDGKIEPGKIRMEATKTALNRTKCQRSLHLCVAPTFVKGDKALWAIVDLTELKVAGTKWTSVGTTGMAITERIFQNKKIMECYCEVINHVQKEDWNFDFTLTRTDGLKISTVKYKSKNYFNSVKLMDWHVSYSNTEGFGYSDAIGCPEYSNAAVIAIEAPEIKALIKNSDTIGFELIQYYFSEGWPTPCSYNYAQHYEFYRDGSFRPIVASLGRGCGNNGTYRPVTRISFAGETQSTECYENNSWKSWKNEAWTLQNESTNYDQDKYLFKLKKTDGSGFLLEANKGQFGDGGRGDHAYYYFTKLHPDKDEGEMDLPTLGPCCNIDYKQGPEKFIDNEALENSTLVLWYVPQLKNDNRKGNEYCWAESVLENGVYVPKVYPCPSGLKIVPLNIEN
ncbi:MAG: hypothetical protein ABI851_07200 [Saprospiraceae bacterium]